MIFILLTCFFPFGALAQTDLRGKKILHVAAYHAEYPWTDSIDKAMRDVAVSKGIDYRVFHMDTKNRSSDQEKTAAGASAKVFIEEFKPDLVITSDDDAVSYLLQPYFKDSSIPFVFNGVNWDASGYGLPYKNTTGMIEVDLVHLLVEHLQVYAKGKRVGLLSVDDNTERKNVDGYTRMLKMKLDKIYLVKTVADWQKAFLKLQNEVDSMLFISYVGIPDWNEAESIIFIEKNVKIPVGANNAWMMPHSMLGLTKVAAEQGNWSIAAALKILGGTNPADIPIEFNKDGKLFVNIKMADRIGLTFKNKTLRTAEIFQ